MGRVVPELHGGPLAAPARWHPTQAVLGGGAAATEGSTGPPAAMEGSSGLLHSSGRQTPGS